MIKKLLIYFMFLISYVGLAQEKEITGIVYDENGMAVPGVNVTIPSINRGVQTNFDGEYSIRASVGQKLVFSFVGYVTKEVTVGNSNQIDVTLETSNEVLDEVLVTGYGGIQSKREVTGAISQVKGDEISDLVTPSFESQLAGRAAGVQVTTQSGIIGESPRFRIRGIASITSGTYPLIVVDGIPIYTGDVGGYASTNALGDINPNDIESIEILKDGSATAIYGSRAANGVVLITTKSGREGRVSINVNSTVGFASPEKFHLLGSQEFVMISNEKRSNRGQADWAAGTEFDTDWQDAVLRSSALQQDYGLSVSGGTSKTKYYFSLGYTDQESVANPNEMTRYTLRANLDQEVTSWINVGMNAGFTRTEYTGLNTGSNSLSGNIFSATRQHPNVPIYNPDHPTGYNIDFEFDNLVGRWDNIGLIGDNLPNIMYPIENNDFYSKINRLIANVYADVSPIDEINFRTQVSVDQIGTNGFLYYSPVHGDGQGSNGRVQNSNNDRVRWNWQNILSYNETFGEDHNLGVVLITEYQKQEDRSFFGSGTDLSNEFFNRNLISGSYGIQGSGGGFSENGFISYAGRINYNFREKYFIQGSLRRDGLSSLPEANRYGTFPGISAGWTISEEGFMDNLGFISDLKVRGSYGKVGNVSIGNYPYLGLYGSAQYGDTNGIAYAQFGNDNLRWETSIKYDFGFDLRMFNNRVSLNFDYFLNDTDDLILDLETPMSLGIPGNSYSSNIGAIENSGVEIALEARVISTDDFTWSLNGNVSFVDNEVKYLVNGQDRISGNNYTITREGESINSIYGFRYWGVNPENGNPVYYKADGSLVQGNIQTSSYAQFDPSNPGDVSQSASLSSADDRTILGNSIPKFFGGIGSNFTYKNFDMGFLFRFSGGNKIFNATRRDLLNQNFTNNSTEILGRWQSPENPGDGWTPRLWAASNTFVNLSSSATTRFVEDGDFIKLDNLSIGYSLPSEVLEAVGLTKMRIYAQGQNFWIITDYSGADPEMEVNGVDLNLTPRSSVFSLGVNIGL